MAKKKQQTNDPMAGLLARLKTCNEKLETTYPGETGQRQPVHTVYGGAHLFRHTFIERLGARALESMRQYAPDSIALDQALGWNRVVPDLYDRIVSKLESEPVEDFRIDFEDGFGSRSDGEEDEWAHTSAEELAKAMDLKQLSPYIGIRVKSFSEEAKLRSVRTLDLFLSALLEKSGGKLPPNFVVTLPKVACPEHASIFCDLLAQLEAHHGLAEGTIKIELMLESPQLLCDREGRCGLVSAVAAAGKRCRGVHFGAFDFTASLGIVGTQQGLAHPACDFARTMMQTALAGTGVWLSDSVTTLMPVAVNRVDALGRQLTAEEAEENRRVVHQAWKLSRRHIERALRTGIYQGWDLHPAQLPVRYASTYGFFLDELPSMVERFKNFHQRSRQATLTGAVFDDEASGRGLTNFFKRAIDCGAVNAQDLTAAGMPEELFSERIH